MRLLVLAVGRLKAGPERALFERYRGRCETGARAAGFLGVDFRDIRESPARGAETRKREEAAELRALAPPGARLVALDERGRAMTSAAFAADLGAARDAGLGATVFLVGGPDGLDPALSEGAALRLAFGAMSWPHQLARVLLAEQIYRAITILSGHPYHRA